MKSFESSNIVPDFLDAIDVAVERMSLEEVRGIARTLIRLLRADNELIKTIQNMLDTQKCIDHLEAKIQGE